jgi:predicted DNA-binding ArsR family transcriptional regulator
MNNYGFKSKKEVLDFVDNFKKMIEDSDEEQFLTLGNDLETGVFLGRALINKAECKNMINKAASLVVNIDEEEDSVSVISLYSHKQNDLFNIKMKGKKSDIYMLG